MLWRQAQLARGVVGGELPDEGVILVEERIVEADAAAHKHLLDAWDLAEFPQQREVALVRDAQGLAGLGAEATAVGAGAGPQLLGAGWDAELGGGATYVVDVPLKVGLVRHQLCLGQHGLVGARLYDASLMEVERAERAVAKAAAVDGERKLDFGQGGDATCRVVAGVPGAGVGQLVYLVKLLGGKRGGGRVLHHVDPVRILLHQRVREKWVQLANLLAKAARIGFLAGGDLLPRG